MAGVNNLDPEIEKRSKIILKDFFGFDSFKGQQQAIINNILSGRNTFVIMPTGAGKSLCYQLPALASEGTAIIISPLIALMKNQVDAIRAFSGEEGIAEFLNSSLNKSESKNVKQNVTDGITKMLYVAPESLAKQENINFFKSVKISFVAVDEAHCISEWGHDFRPEYRRIKQMIAEIGNIPIIALTATATPKVQIDIQKNLSMPDATLFKSSFNRPNLYYEIRPKIDVNKSIIRYIKDNMGKSGIVYTLSRKKAEEVAQVLQANGIKALPYHAGLDANVRVRHQDAFLKEDTDVIVATIAFGMGIDKPNVRFVIHYDIPKSMESYYQETGRAGRDGLEGVCIAYYSHADIQKLEKFMKDKPVSEKEIGHLLLNEVVSYVESSVCRRRQIMHYFGEDFDERGCAGKCDACKNPQPRQSVEAEFKYFIDSVFQLGKKFDSSYFLNFVMGEHDDRITAYGHQNHPNFGKGKEKGLAFWNAIIKFALLYDFLLKDIENYGLLKLSEKGEAYLANPHGISVPEDYNYANAKSEDNQGDRNEAADPVLFGMLKDLCKKVAKERNLPPYVIFQDTSLEDMATIYPITLPELTNCTGVGQGKANKFGKQFIELISQYVDANEIDRPSDIVIKTNVNKSANKVFIINSIDRKIPLADVGNSKGLSYIEILNEIETIVQSGTRVNIDYHINEVLDHELQMETYEYFRSAESDRLDKALEELGDDYSPEDIQLMRIKFLSEQSM